MKKILLYTFLLFSTISFTQTYTMSNANVNSCSGTFYDSGGAGGDYANGESFTKTFCPSTAGTKMRINFTAFATEASYDFLTVYDGATTAAPVLGVFAGTAGPGLTQATAGNASGCLTFKFTSDGSGIRSGWTGLMSCVFPCQNVIPVFTTTPAAVAGIIKICAGTSVAFNGSGTNYPNNNAGYTQSNSTSTFNWTFGDGTNAVGINVNKTFSTPGIYPTVLKVTDVNGCLSTLNVQVIVQVPKPTKFNGSFVTNPTICQGLTNTLTGVASPQLVSLPCTPPVSGVTFLPDGSGVSYSSGINVSCYTPGQTISSIADIQNVCLNIEHSCLSDLDFRIVCPNGQSVSLKDWPGGSCQYLGSANDDNGFPAGPAGPGVGAQYCFSPGASTLLINATSIQSGAPLGNSYSAGNYAAAGNWGNLIGCPLNGNWSIGVTDHTSADDGYIFNWDVNFNVAPPATASFTPTIVSQGWLPDPTITTTAGGTITVTPTAAGTKCYTYRATDSFGCVKDTVICFTVLAASNPLCNNCLITNFTANSNLGNCQTELVTTGTVSFSGAPTTGQLIVEDCQGNQVVLANAPFTSPYNYTLNGTDANGAACFFKACFTANASCVSTINTVLLLATPNDEAGTVTPSQGGPGSNFLRVCQTGTVTVTSNNNYAIPPLFPGDVPALGYFVYSCPPAIGGIGITPTNDPCYEGFYTTQNVTFTNTNGLASPLFAGWGAMTNNTFYIVPMTFNDLTPVTYHQDCYDLAIDQMTTVQFLNPIVAVSTPNCTTGAVSTTFTGGNPQFYGGNFTASSLLPVTASFGNTTCVNGGVIVINGLTNGQAWSFNILDANGCPKVISGTFTGLQSAAFTYPQPSYCKNAANPSPTITGVPGGSFTSTPAGLSINATTGLVNLAASTVGAYTITYSSPGPLCIGTATFSLTILAQPIVNAGSDQTVCVGTSVTLSASGANTYTWNNGVTDGVAFNPAVGTLNYTATGTAVNGCTNTDIVTVTVNALPIVNAGIDQTKCLGQTATLAGAGAATYSWVGPNAVTNGVLFTPAVGTNSYTVTGSTATVPACTNTDIVVITVNPIPVTSAGADVTVCTGGSVTLTGSGAATYTWSGGITNGVAFTPASSGNYTVTGTSLGCTSTDLVAVIVQANAPINAGLDVTICAGASTTLVATGGVSYTFNNGLGAGNNFSITPAATVTYTVNGTDANSCTGVDQVTITVTPLPIVNAGVDQTVCQGVATTLTGTGAATYSWSGGITNGTAFTQVVGTVAYTVTGTQSGCVATDIVNVTVNSLPIISAGVDQTVCAGTAVTLTATGAPTITWSSAVSNGVAFTPAAGTITYTATGTSLQNCVATDQVNVVVNALPIVNAGVDQTVCAGTSITLTATGATTYAWTNGITNGTAFSPTLGSLSYTVTGTNANSCQNTDIVNVTVNPNPVPVINGAANYCSGTTSQLTTSAPFTSYAWNTGATAASVNVTTINNPVNVTVQNAFGCSGTSANFTVTQTAITTANSTITVCQGVVTTIHGTPRSVAGTYSQTFLGGSISGCDSISNVTLVVNPLPLVNAGVDQAYCTGINTTLTGSNATTYFWSNAVQNGITFTQAVGTTTYTLTGTDANGCVNTDNVNVTVYPLPVVSAGSDFAICAGATATLVGAGATTYTWTNPVINNTAFSPIATSTYTLTGTNANGCVNTDQIIVTVNALPIVNAGADLEICDDATATLTATGATTYTWTNGVVNATSFNPTPGTLSYTVTGTDANGCIDSDIVQVTVNALPVVIATASDIEICIGDIETLTGSGAGAGANYSWNNGVINAISFSPGIGSINYTVTGTDVKGCVDTDAITVLVHALPNVNAGIDQSVCAGGAVTLSGAGASTYTWNNAVTNTIAFIPLSSGTYTVTGTDVFGCIKTDQVLVTVNALPIVNAGVDFTICTGTTALLSASGALTYVWNNGTPNGTQFTPIASGVFSVVGTDGNGCVNTDNVSITLENAPVISFVPDKTEGCKPVVVTFANTTTGAATTIWNFSDGSSILGNGNLTHTFNVPGCYDVSMIATSANGCISTTSQTDLVCVEDFPIATFNATPEVMTQISTLVEFENTSVGADTYDWDFGDDGSSILTNPTHTFPFDKPGSYAVVLIASTNYGCKDTAYQTIVVNDELLYFIPNTFTPDEDKYNPTFTPVFTSGFDPQQYVMYIFNRWGEIIFETHDTSIGWSGNYQGKKEIVVDGTYTYKIEFKTTNGKRISTLGHVNILR
jgi:gliding motility-associated-like protein